MQSHHVDALLLRTHVAGLLLLKIEGGGIDDLGLGVAMFQQGGRHQRTGIQHHAHLAQQARTAQGDEVGRTGAGPDEINFHAFPFEFSWGARWRCAWAVLRISSTAR